MPVHKTYYENYLFYAPPSPHCVCLAFPYGILQSNVVWIDRGLTADLYHHTKRNAGSVSPVHLKKGRGTIILYNTEKIKKRCMLFIGAYSFLFNFEIG